MSLTLQHLPRTSNGFYRWSDGKTERCLITEHRTYDAEHGERVYIANWPESIRTFLSATCKRPACWVDASRVSFDVEVVAA